MASHKSYCSSVSHEGGSLQPRDSHPRAEQNKGNCLPVFESHQWVRTTTRFSLESMRDRYGILDSVMLSLLELRKGAINVGGLDVSVAL